ncbi:SusC/RagA family TonB-linked outer membrane protein [Flammeovirga yaeyamensis]|uniref:SusC/RagA family TonB-linked outer membrane protein n=1 Tax=Flammeovirga yaeyamensis TaxID=367791 RepID=A0AAX1N375_9BACT|nr:TonB-dependent receptor [Flammeovirga yaeyamensis]MBB3700766.1 TonB-linked SusC/RagA family outer membrane protein [Flammeovirga yaeyamensis]NMF37878.1 TonB-dependent receptor [Flammeovirga yaeyamensis]QWG01761.1 SusC/RagA family TonB-linked outer membrane protein [Flammeovirga yaeyamensis]
MSKFYSKQAFTKLKQSVFLFTFLCCLSLNVYAQKETRVSGTVYDESGEALIGVNVKEFGTSYGSVTDFNGHFSLVLTTEDPVLEFSFVGFVTKQLRVGTQSKMKVILEEDVAQLEEIIVVGYGSQTKSQVASAISSVEAEEMNKIPTADVGEMLRGKAAGVQISLDNASPGGSSSILIRGSNSISGGNDPLIIVDGVAVGSINDVNPNDIASLEVLKDASSQAIYGARASNGVILITTHRGEEGKVKVSYDGFVGFQNAVQRNFDLYNGDEFAQLAREAHRNDNYGIYQPDDIVFSQLQREVLASGQFVDWEQEVLRQNTVVTQHNVSVRGGNDKTKAAFSAGYYKNDGLLPGSDYQRVNLRLNVDQKVNDWLTIGSNISFMNGLRNREANNLNYLTNSPLSSIYNEDGTYRRWVADKGQQFNPFINIDETDRQSTTNKGLYNVFLDFKLPFDIKYRANASYRHNNVVDGNYQSSLEQQGIGKSGIASHYNDNTTELMLENIVTWEKKFNKHKIDFTGVQSTIERRWGRTKNDAFGFSNDLLGWKGIAGAETQQVERSETERNLLSFMGRARYSYDGKYIFTATARADASSVFGDNNKWGYFPSLAVAWNIHRENIFNGTDFLDVLKFRASYGSVGNEAISPYSSLGTATEYYYIFNGNTTAGFAPDFMLPNPNLRWETTTTLNTGIDFGFFDGRIQGAFEYYHATTKDLLITRDINSTTGYTKMIDNVGSVENTGFELTLTAEIIRKKDLSISLTPVFSMNRNKITELYGGLDVIPNVGSTTGWLFVGQPISVYYDYEFDGIWQTGDPINESHMTGAKPGDIRLKDQNGDGVLDDDDRIIYDRTPNWMGSLALNVNYKNFDFSADFYTVQGQVRHNSYLTSNANGGDLRGNRNGIKVDYWTPENPSNTAPAPSNAQSPLYMDVLGYQKTSFVRLRSMVLGYSLGEKALNKLQLQRLRLYTSVTNPFTWMNYPSYSPEKEPGSYPEAFIYNFGVNVTF